MGWIIVNKKILFLIDLIRVKWDFNDHNDSALLDTSSLSRVVSAVNVCVVQAVQQMEERLAQFLEANQVSSRCPNTEESDGSLAFVHRQNQVSSRCPSTEESDGSLAFVHRQIITLAQDCLDKSHSQLLSALYFHELSESLRTLSIDVSLFLPSTPSNAILCPSTPLTSLQLFQCGYPLWCFF